MLRNVERHVGLVGFSSAWLDSVRSDLDYLSWFGLARPSAAQVSFARPSLAWSSLVSLIDFRSLTPVAKLINEQLSCRYAQNLIELYFGCIFSNAIVEPSMCQ